VDTLAFVTIVADILACLGLGAKQIIGGNLLLLTVVFLDSPWYLMNVMVQSLGYHIQHVIEMGFYTDAFAQLAMNERVPNDGVGAEPAWATSIHCYCCVWCVFVVAFVDSF
jgi:choline-glycine betaine transporter